MNSKFWILLALTVVCTACGPGNPCTRPSPCPNDTMKTEAEKQSCVNTFNANMNAKCFSENVNVANCWLDQTVCTSDGKTDGINTFTKISNNCNTQGSALTSCCNNNPTSTACR